MSGKIERMSFVLRNMPEGTLTYKKSLKMEMGMGMGIRGTDTNNV